MINNMEENQLYPSLVNSLEKDFAFEKQLLPALKVRIRVAERLVPVT